MKAEAPNTGVDSDFLVDLSKYKKIELDVKSAKLSAGQKEDLLANISIIRDSIVLFTATGAARGVSGHTGGPFDTAPEVSILEALFSGEKTKDHYVPIVFDEAGHRVATQVSITYFLLTTVSLMC